MHHILIFGLGYTATALAKRLSPDAWQISATSRSRDGVAAIQDSGYRAFQFSDDHPPSPELRAAVSNASHIVVSTPPGSAGDPVLHTMSDNLIAATQLKWVGYLSTIGVYGDHDGQWIDETTPATPTSARSKRRLAAEQAWQQLAERSKFNLNIFRLAGIYGPGRSAFDKLRSGRARAIINPGQVFNRIHVDDAAEVISAALHDRGEHIIYNVTDDLPAPPQDVLDHAAELMGVAPPNRVSLDEAALSEMAKSFYSENKRVRNRRIKDDLDVALSYPTYKEGLTMIHRAKFPPAGS